MTFYVNGHDVMQHQRHTFFQIIYKLEVPLVALEMQEREKKGE